MDVWRIAHRPIDASPGYFFMQLWRSLRIKLDPKDQYHRIHAWKVHKNECMDEQECQITIFALHANNVVMSKTLAKEIRHFRMNKFRWNLHTNFTQCNWNVSDTTCLIYFVIEMILIFLSHILTKFDVRTMDESDKIIERNINFT